MKLEDEKLIRQYLLGELNEQVLTQVETRLMTDDDFDSQVQFIEDELIEEYVCSELNAQEREKFEQMFLTTPAGREKVEFAAAFRTYIKRPEPKPAPVVIKSEPTSWFGALVAFWKAHKDLTAYSLALVVLLLSVNIWLAIKSDRAQNRLSELEAQQAAFQAETAALKKERDEANTRATKAQDEAQAINQEKEKLAQELASLQKPEKKTGETASLGDSVFAMLQPLDDTRGSTSGNAPPLTLNKPTLRLGLKFTQDIFKSFRATVKNRDGSSTPFVVTPSRGKKSGSASIVVLKIPAAQLTDGRYEIALTGTTSEGKTELIDKYAFSVKKTP
jgi:hypothetical protein